MLKRRPDIPGVFAVGGPRTARLRLVVDQHASAGWAKWRGIVIEDATDLVPSGQLRVHTRSAEHIECQFGLWNQFVPQVKWKFGMDRV
jgi:hypothetical protein